MISVKTRISGQTNSEVSAVRDVSKGGAILVVYDDNGAHIYSLSADDPAIESLAKILVDERNPE